MSYTVIAILVIGALFVATRVVRLAHVVDVLRSVAPDQNEAKAHMRARELARSGEIVEGDDTEAVGVALALALREAESEARGLDVDRPV